jgi:hypothetical protein
VSRGWGLAGLLAGVTVVLEVAFRHAAHPHFPWHAVPAYDLVLGLLGGALLVVAPKALGRAGLRRPGTYYGEDE